MGLDDVALGVAACRLLDIPTHVDERGSLSVVETAQLLPFDIARVYYLHHLVPDVTRGAHAHRALQQFMVAVHGALDVVLDDGAARRTVRLDSASRGLLISPMVWRELCAFAPHTVCVVLASLPYDAADYIHDYHEFVRCAVEPAS